MPTILLKKSDTPGSVPGTANLTNLAGGVEVAVNTADKRVYSMTSASAVIELGTNPSSLTCSDVSATVLRSASATITNLIATSASITTLTNNPTFSAGTANGVLYLNGSKVATSGSDLTFNGTVFRNNAGGGVGIYGLTGSDSVSNQFYLQNTAGNKAANFQLGSTGILQTWVYGGSTWVNATTIDSSGNLGIGTASPGSKLDVRGANSNNLSDLGAQIVNAIDTTAYAQNNGGGIGFGYVFNSGGSVIGRAAVIKAVKENATDGNYATSLVFANAANSANTIEKMRLDSSGNLGLGVTPSAWQTDVKAIQIGDAGSNICANNAAYSGANNVWINSNSFQNSSVQDIYIRTATAGQYNIQGNTHIWKTAPSGTAGNTISFTQAMTLDASGRLLVGHTSASTSLTRTIELTGASSAALDQPAYLCSANTGTTAAFTGYLNFIRSRGTTAGSKTVVVSGDRLGMVRFTGTDGSGDVPAAEIYAEVDGTAGVNDMPGRIVFATTADGTNSSTERARITSGGDFTLNSVGTSGTRTLTIQTNTSGDPTLVLSAAGADTGQFWFERSTLRLYARASNTGGVYLASGGTSWTAVSDERKKDIIEPITNAAEKVASLRAVVGKYKTDQDGVRRSFLIAQDVQAVFPEAVDASDENELGLSYTDTIPLLVAAIKELKVELDAAKAKIAALEAK